MIWSPKIGDKVFVRVGKNSRKFGWAPVADIREGGAMVETGSRQVFVADSDMVEYWAFGLDMPIENFCGRWVTPGRAQMQARGQFNG